MIMNITNKILGNSYRLLNGNLNDGFRRDLDMFPTGQQGQTSAYSRTCTGVTGGGTD
jgi:hypothetical protein